MSNIANRRNVWRCPERCQQCYERRDTTKSEAPFAAH